MSQIQTNLAAKLLQEHFGDMVMKVGKCLLERGSSILGEIRCHTKETLPCIKNSLCVIIHHNFATFQLNSHGLVSYQMKAESVFRMLNYPLYVDTAEELFGIEGKLIIEEILLNGKLTVTEVIDKVADKIKKSGNTIENYVIREKFETILQKHFVKRSPSLVPVSDHSPAIVPTFINPDSTTYTMPLVEGNERTFKRIKLDESVSRQDDVYFIVNFDEFEFYLRDKIIIKAIRRRFDDNAATVISTMLKSMEHYRTPKEKCGDSNPISKHTIKNELHSMPLRTLEQYLSLLAEDSVQIISKVDDHQGGTYSVRLSKFIHSLTWAMIDRIVEEKFSSKHARIFRLIRMKDYLEQKQIESLSMIQPKDAKLITYTLLKENLIHLQDIPQSADYAPAKTYYLFCIRFRLVVRMLLEWCYKAVFNLKVARESEVRQNKRLLDKKQKIDVIVNTLKSEKAEESQIAEVEEMITPPEIAVLQKVQMASNKLESGEIHLLENILIFNLCVQSFTEDNNKR